MVLQVSLRMMVDVQIVVGATVNDFLIVVEVIMNDRMAMAGVIVLVLVEVFVTWTVIVVMLQ